MYLLPDSLGSSLVGGTVRKFTRLTRGGWRGVDEQKLYLAREEGGQFQSGKAILADFLLNIFSFFIF